jgi:hypothetical protein
VGVGFVTSETFGVSFTTIPEKLPPEHVGRGFFGPLPVKSRGEISEDHSRVLFDRLLPVY